jgi:hypothetical protein
VAANSRTRWPSHLPSVLLRAVSSHPVLYAELPGAHHDFDLYESIRSAAVSQAVEQFTARISASPDNQQHPTRGELK